MSFLDRLGNRARGAVADSRKRFEESGGLDGVAKRAEAATHTLKERAQDIVVKGVVTESLRREDPLRSAADAEVDALRSAVTEPARTPSPTEPGLATELAQLDAKRRRGELSAAEWADARAELLDALDRSRDKGGPPRKRTL